MLRLEARDLRLFALHKRESLPIRGHTLLANGAAAPSFRSSQAYVVHRQPQTQPTLAF
jgi:hypothetical protein